MQEIRYGLKDGIDISSYLNPNINYKEMKEIRLKLKENENE